MITLDGLDRRLDEIPMLIELIAKRLDPKLFRRCVSYLTDRFHGFRGNLREWLENEAGPGNDVMVVGGKLMRLSALVASADRSITTRIDATRALFVAR